MKEAWEADDCVIGAYAEANLDKQANNLTRKNAKLEEIVKALERLLVEQDDDNSEGIETSKEDI